jgi:polar amino acid transport system permease protein
MEVIRDYSNMILDGTWVTVQLTVLAFMGSLVFSFVFGLAKTSPFRLIRWIAVTYIEFFRGTSVLVQLFWVFYAFPLFGVFLEPFEAGVIALSLNGGAYGAEIIRGAVLAVPRAQIDAAVALNYSSWNRWWFVVLPQAVPMMLPPLCNEAINMVKASAVVSLITISDLTFVATIIRKNTGLTLEPYMTSLILYFAISLAVIGGFRFLERRFGRYRT